MKSFSPLIFLLCFLFAPESNFAQVILFEVKESDVHKKIYFDDNKVFFEINNNLIANIQVNPQHFLFLTSPDEKSHGIVNFYFSMENEKSHFEIYLLEGNFNVSFYKKISFEYEEPIPIFYLISSKEIALLNKAEGKLKILSANKESDFDLIKNGNEYYNQERIGHIFSLKNKLIVVLSHIKQINKFLAKVFSLNLATNEVEEITIDANYVHKAFLVGNQLFLSGVNTERLIDGAFYSVNLQNQLSPNNIKKISDLIVEGIVKNTVNLFYSYKCFYLLEDEKLKDLGFCFDDEIILDASKFDDQFYVITRRDLSTIYYELNNEFKISKRVVIDQYLRNPTLYLLNKNRIQIRESNKVIFEKFILEVK